jgi:hypothetical protein
MRKCEKRAKKKQKGQSIFAQPFALTAYLPKYLSSSPAKALPWRASSFAIS